MKIIYPSSQLNTIGRIQKYMEFKTKEIIINCFLYSNFNYCPLAWHFCTYIKKSKKIEKKKKRCKNIVSRYFVYIDTLSIMKGKKVKIQNFVKKLTSEENISRLTFKSLFPLVFWHCYPFLCMSTLLCICINNIKYT